VILPARTRAKNRNCVPIGVDIDSMRMVVTVLSLLFIGATVYADEQQLDNQVRIVRDNYGTPHIYAHDIYGLYYGYGYSIAQDRLFQIEMARRSTQGTVAEVFGKDYLDYDKGARTLFDPDSIYRQLAKLEKKDRDVFEGYAAGINAWLQEVRKAPAHLTPKQFVDLDFSPADWSAYDIVMIFVGTMNNRYGDFNTELENAAIYEKLMEQHGEQAATQLFDLLNPRFTDDAPTTIPQQDWSRPAYDSMATTTVRFVPKNPIQTALANPVTTGFSNCYLIGKNKLVDGGSILINGPQFGWFNPSYVYSVGMHGAGIDVVGNSPFGYPMIMFGHNQTISWGSTWGASDIVDIFVEQLNPEDSSQYLYKGEYINLNHRVEKIGILGEDTIDFDVYRSVHGPIILAEPESGVVYAKRRAWEGAELDTLLAWLYATWASDFGSWKAEAEKSAINVNMYFADVDGNIGFFHGGHFPERVAGHDNRFPVTGDGSMDWRGRQPVALANPHVLNPETDFLANWNNKPGHGVMNPDYFFYSWSAADRVEILHQELSSKEKFTAEEAWAIIEKSSYADVSAQYFVPLIVAATSGSDNPMSREASKILQTWNGNSRDHDEDGFYDEAATAIYRAFIGSLVERLLSDDLGTAYAYFSGSGYPSAAAPSASGTNIPPALKAIYEALQGRSSFDIQNGETADSIIKSTLHDVLEELTTGAGMPLGDIRLDVAKRPFSTRNFLGIPQASESEAMIGPIEQNRGTENNMIVMKRDAIVAWEVTPPGQNAFISPDGVTGKHYDDQFEMYNKFGRKRVWFYKDDVEANRQSETILEY
jgi:penicillin amidase